MMRTIAIASLLLVGCAVPGAVDELNPSKAPAAPSKEHGLFGGAQTTAASLDSGCSEEAKFPYVLSRDGVLYRFDPREHAFFEIGPIGCRLEGDQTVISMAVDRSGTAWVSTTTQHLLKVDVKDASCTMVPDFSAGAFGWRSFGMGFSSDRAGSEKETLYIAELTADPVKRPSKGLGQLSGDLTFSAIGTYDGTFAGASAELTGTGDGRLFAFMVQDNVTRFTATLAQLDKVTGQITESIPLGFRVNAGYAFSFWGGDFWFYTSAPGHTGSQVTQLRYATDKGEAVVVPPQDFDIVGAGVSTCAPTSPVK